MWLPLIMMSAAENMPRISHKDSRSMYFHWFEQNHAYKTFHVVSEM